MHLVYFDLGFDCLGAWWAVVIVVCGRLSVNVCLFYLVYYLLDAWWFG